MQTRPPDAPLPPCHAYQEVAALLPPWYLVAHTPPERGRKLIVASLVDRVTAYFEMDTDTAKFIYDKLRSSDAQVHVSVATYDNRD